MPKSPQVSYKFENNNTQYSQPSSGVTHVLARTTRGPFCKPDTIITTISQFENIYGKEVVPDGSVSNIAQALSMGSALRISRVPGGEPVAFGVASTFNPITGIATPKAILNLEVENPMDSTQKFKLGYTITTREPGSSVVTAGSDNTNQNWFLGLIQTLNGPLATIKLVQAYDISVTGDVGSEKVTIKSDRIIATDTLLVKNHRLMSSNNMIDFNTFKSFCESASNVTLTFESCTGSLPNISTVKTMEDSLSLLQTYQNWYAKVSIGAVEVTEEYQYLSIPEGTNGSKSTVESWVKAADAMMDYNEAYSLFLSHLHQHLPVEYAVVYTQVHQKISSMFETKLLVEIPKYSADGNVKDIIAIRTEADAIASSVDYHKAVVMFAGGIKLYDETGTLRNCDVLGTVVGLENQTANTVGQWRSFSGMNRGVVPGAKGPVMPNLGSPTKYPELDSLAQAKVNLFVVKPTPAAGNQTMLWHGFTCFYMDKSDKFIASVNLSLYLKKQIRPILEGALEEPNNFELWKNIYLRVKPIIDDLVPSAMSSYEWIGDQFATTFSDCVINTEATARAGKYKARLRYKDVVTLQEVEMIFEVDAVTREINVN